MNHKLLLIYHTCKFSDWINFILKWIGMNILFWTSILTSKRSQLKTKSFRLYKWITQYYLYTIVKTERDNNNITWGQLRRYIIYVSQSAWFIPGTTERGRNLVCVINDCSTGLDGQSAPDGQAAHCQMWLWQLLVNVI